MPVSCIRNQLALFCSTSAPPVRIISRWACFLCEAASGNHVLGLVYSKHRLMARAVTPRWHDLGGCLVWLVSFPAIFVIGSSFIVRHKILGMLLLLTIQAGTAILHRRGNGQLGVERPWLLGYICITFVLATIGFAANVKYTEMIWIDLRDAPGGPAALIQDELSYWINVMALAWYVV